MVVDVVSKAKVAETLPGVKKNRSGFNIAAARAPEEPDTTTGLCGCFNFKRSA
jgi:hypothetical protein